MTATPTDPAALETSPLHVTRVEVRAAEGALDPHGDATLADAQAELPGVTAIHTATVFLIEAPLSEAQAARVANELLADPVNQAATLGVAPRPEHSALIETHYLPGVMDPVATSTEDAIVEMLPELDAAQVSVRTGTRYDLVYADGQPHADGETLAAFAERYLANTVVQSIELDHAHPSEFPHGHHYELQLSHVPIRDLDEAGLMTLSRDGHLFLSLDEMQAIQNYYRDAGREPTDVELETLAQTWSEHCVHKTLKATVSYTPGEGSDTSVFENKPGHELNDDGTVTIHNLLKCTVAAATFKLKEDPTIGDWLVSVFDDNAGIVKFDDEDGVAIKVETHNHPSAIEPYGGAATGIGGCIRDIMGTGLSAKPIANTDTFAVASPDTTDLPKGVLHPKRVLQQVVAGVRDYGNRMGIPTVNGAVLFHDDFLGNPLVFAGCVGIIPLDKCFGDPEPGDKIVILGGRTGRDGIHGATFSSAELTDTHADEFSHAVQIGNAITEKKTLDVILQARDYVNPETGEAKPLFTAISDCGAGGFSSAVGEMGEKVGAYVELDKAPLKYDGLTYTEIWISEAQERMPLAVPAENVEALQKLADAEDVEMCVLGHFGYEEDGKPTLKLTYHGEEVGTLGMSFMHDGIPMPTREAAWPPANTKPQAAPTHDADDLSGALTGLLSNPNIASKHWIIRQYDHEVQGGSAVKPLVGPGQDGPSDGAVIRPKLGSNRAVALANGVAPFISEKANETGHATDGDSYYATLAAIDEAMRNAVCVGADPDKVAILDNFCWPKCDDPAMLGTLVRAAEACYDGAIAYKTPFVSGKDSLSNQFTTEDGGVITIPQTLLVTSMGIVDDATKARTMDAKAAGNALLIVGETTGDLGGSQYAMLGGDSGTGTIPKVDLAVGPQNAKAVASLIDQRLIASAHDCSEGGLLVAAAEMAFAGRIGLDLDLTNLPAADGVAAPAACFAETPSRYLLEVAPDKLDAAVRSLRDAGVPFAQIGTFADHANLTLRTPDKGQRFELTLDALRQAWLGPLDW